MPSGFNTENTGVLLDLARTEKGLCLEMTEQVLGMMEQEETDAYWEEQFKRGGGRSWVISAFPNPTWFQTGWPG